MSTNSELIAQQLAEAVQVRRIWDGIMYNVLNEGLVGGGTVDDTAALQALVNKAILEGRRTIFFPHVANGQYKVTSLTNADQVDFVGDNCSFVGGFDGTIGNMGGIAAHLADTMSHGETATGKIIYVDIVNGSDTNDGSQVTPYKHINYALSKLKKILYSAVKIRVLPGDYTSEGQIVVEYFKTNTLTITAFDGNSDIVALSDSYKVKKFGFYNCDSVILSGFRIMNTDADYGVYAQYTKFIKCTAIKNIETTPTSDGFGLTFATTAHLVGCLCSGKGTVVSSNNGSKVISEAWDAGSVSNITTLKAQWGGQIHKIGTQPNGTNNDQHINAGTIIEETGDLFVSRSYNTFTTKDATLTGATTIPINLPNLPKTIKIDASLTGTKEMSWGVWSRNDGVTPTQSAIARSNSDNGFGSFSLVHLTDGVNTVEYKVTSATNGLITLEITKTGSPTGTIHLSVICEC